MGLPVVAVDIDEVLFPFNARVLSYYNQIDGTSYTAADLQDHDFQTLWRCDLAAGVKRMHRFHKSIHSGIPPLQGSVDGLTRLKRYAHVVVVSSRDDDFRDDTVAWLSHHYPNIFGLVELVGNHYNGKPYRLKGDVCLELGVKLLIDDQLRYVLDVAERGIPCVLFGDYSHNRLEPLPKLVTRAHDWVAAERQAAKILGIA